MQITEALLVGNLAQLQAEQAQIVAQLNAKNGAIEAVQIVLNTLRLPEPGEQLPPHDLPPCRTAADAPEMLPVVPLADTDEPGPLVERKCSPNCECNMCETGAQ